MRSWWRQSSSPITTIMLTVLGFSFLYLYLVREFREAQAKDIVQLVRSDLLLGDRNRGLYLLSSKIGENEPFAAIEFFERSTNKSFLVGDRFGQKFDSRNVGNHFLFGNLEILIDFGVNEGGSFGKLKFFYFRFEDVKFVITILVCLMSMQIALFYRGYIRSRNELDQRLKIRKSETIAEMARMLTHDMRAPIGTFERLLLVERSEDVLSLKPAIRESVNRLYTMIDALRYGEVENIVRKSYAKLDFGFGYQSLLILAAKKQIFLTVPQTTFDRVNIDEAKVERSWINLATNAIEFARTFVHVEAVVIGYNLLIRVIDDGPGVPDAIQPKLFQRGATFGKHDGTGLGLAYVRQIMRGHGGDVTYRREGELTIFECLLPGAVVEEDQQVMEHSAFVELKQEQTLQRRVAICLEPPELKGSVLSKLVVHNSDDLFFSEQQEGANVVVGNQQLLMIEVAERDEQEYVSVALLGNDVDRIVAFLYRKFEIR